MIVEDNLVTNLQADASVFLKEIKNIEVEGKSILIQGLPGMGLIGRIAANFFLKHKNFNPIEVARVYSSYLPPIVQVDKIEGIGRLARLEIYVITETTPNIVLVTGDFQPIEIGIIQVLNRVLDYVEQFNVDTSICLGGLRTQEEKPDVVAFTYTEETLEWLKKFEIVPLRGGEVSGAVGVLSALASERDWTSYGLLGRLTLTGADPIASKFLLESLEKIYEFKFDYTSLDEAIEDAKKKDQQVLDLTKQAIDDETETDNGPGYYI